MIRWIVIASTLVVSGCVTSRVEESRSAVTGIETDEALVLLGRARYNDRQTEESFTRCIADALKAGERPIRMIPEDEFKDSLYPWFEPRTAPTSATELSTLFAQPGVRQRIEDAQVRYLAWIDGDTITTDQGGSFSCTISSFGGGQSCWFLLLLLFLLRFDGEELQPYYYSPDGKSNQARTQRTSL